MGEIVLLGTSHIAAESVRQIRQAIEELQPDIVAVELDHRRLAALLHGDKTSVQLADIRRIGLKGFLFALVGGIVQRQLGEKVGVMPGADMVSAVKLAQEQQRKIALIDQDIEVTLQRFSQRLSWKERGRFAIDIIRSLLFGKRELKRYGLSHIDLRKVPSEELIEKMMKVVRVRYPNVYRVLVAERNTVMVYRLMHLAVQNQDAKILAVVGAGHLEGMRELLRANAQTATVPDRR